MEMLEFYSIKLTFYKDEIIKGPLYNTYLDRLDINTALNFTEKNYEQAGIGISFSIILMF